MNVKKSPHEEYDRGFSNGWDACAARAQPTQAGQMLTDDALWELWNAQGCDDMNQSEAMSFARAIEQAVRAKLGAGVPMTDEQRYSEFCNWYANAECQMTPSAIFDEAFRRAENAHGIVGKEGA